MTAALEGGEWSAARPGRTLPRERPGTQCTGGWVGPRADLDGIKISSPPRFDPREHSNERKFGFHKNGEFLQQVTECLHQK